MNFPTLRKSVTGGVYPSVRWEEAKSRKPEGAEETTHETITSHPQTRPRLRETHLPGKGGRGGGRRRDGPLVSQPTSQSLSPHHEASSLWGGG